jgi:hypothetical protein
VSRRRADHSSRCSSATDASTRHPRGPEHATPGPCEHRDRSHHHGSAVHVSTPCRSFASAPYSSQYASSAPWITALNDAAHEGRTASHQRRPHDRRSRRINLPQPPGHHRTSASRSPRI